jgi:4-hydroxy-tetrahydrodipicolinate synthase
MTVTLKGFVPAVVTPFDAAERIDEAGFATIVAHMRRLGAGGICVAGDNGESWSLDIAERRRLTEIAVAGAGDLPVVTGISAPTLRQSLAYLEAARAGGAQAVLAMPPTYVLKASRDELLRRFAALGKAGLPIILYNSPRRAGVDLSVDDVEALLEVAPIIGIKESSRELAHHTSLIERVGHRIAVMTGPSHFILPCAGLGAAGYIATGPELLGVTGAQLSAIGRGMPDAHYVATHNRLNKLYTLLMGQGTWPAALKHALNLIGLPAGAPRDPVLPLAGVQAEAVRATLDRLGLLPE